MTELRPAIRTDLGAIVAAGLVCLVVVVAIPGAVVVRTVTGLPFMLFGVGYCVMRAVLGPRRSDVATSAVLSIALSIAAAIVIGLVLYAAGIAFDARSVIAGDVLIAAGAAGVAARRSGARTWPSRSATPAVPGREWLWGLLVAAAVFAAAVLYLARPLTDGSVAGYTALAAFRSGAGEIAVEVDNERNQRAALQLRITGSALTVAPRAISLAPGGRWQGQIAVGASAGATIDITLYRDGAPGAILRQVILRG
jgi:hypothetical protein